MLPPMSADRTVIHNARQNNLKGITVEIPHHQLTVITGPSGSGKSSLAFDTLYAEGQRRYIESLSTYAKQFLNRMPKPAMDRVEGIAPAVAIEQKNPTTSSRSTVGTATEIHDYLRLLWARAGTPHCAACGGNVVSHSPSTGAQQVVEDHGDGEVTIAFPLPRSETPVHELIVDNLRAMGFMRVLVGPVLYHLDDLPPEARLDGANPVLVVVDRVRATAANRGRIADSLATAFVEGEGTADVLADTGSTRLTQRPQCATCGMASLSLTPNLFSFNNPRGACTACNGFGAILEYDESLIVPDPNRTLSQGALDPWTKPRYTGKRRILRETATARRIPQNKPWHELAEEHQSFLLNGSERRYVGMFPFLRGLERKRYKQYVRVFLRQYQKAITCPECSGARLRAEARAVTVGGSTLAEVSAMTAADIADWLRSLELPPFEREVASTILRELNARVGFLNDVGLSYLTLERQTRTLSGGEAQRIALANALGASLVDTLYVLDEPSIGLHPRDIDRLLGLLHRLRDAGNTVVIVEHDPSAILAADHMIELGPGSGTGGGDLIYAGTPAGAERAGTLTGEYLAGTKRISVPTARRRSGPRWLTIKGASLHNLRNVDAAIPLNTLTVVTGVSGSGKSTLVHDVVYRQVALRVKGAHGAKEHLGEQIGQVDELTGWEALHDVVLVDQAPIGRSPRSNPITYVRAFDEIRKLFADQPLARARGYTPAMFSFNTGSGGRCHACEGAGHIVVEMVFLADVYVPCEACGGSRYESEVLDVKIKGLSISDVLDLTVDETIKRFRHQDKLGKTLWHLQQVGLGYLRLGQPATTLSGGEAQRLKIARQLATVGKKGGRRLYILDEPTTGLHLDDVRTLLRVLDRLVDAGHTVVVIEHHLDVIKRADWIIDLGPEGGAAGGQIVAAGTPEMIADSGTHTGRFLVPVLETPADTDFGVEGAIATTV